MLQDTVLVGGFAFLISGAVIWVLLNKVNASDWTARTKRMANYALIACLIAMAVIVIDWHSSNYKAENQKTGALIDYAPAHILSERV